MSTARVDFTRGAAERIAAVVRRVEQGDRDQTGPTYGRVGDTGGGSAPRRGTFTGPWAVGETRIVTLLDGSSTVSVTNYCVPAIGDDASTPRPVVFARVNGTQSVLEIGTLAGTSGSFCGTYRGPDLITLSFASCFGSGAAAKATDPGGKDPDDAGPITAFQISNPGSGYAAKGRSEPSVSITGSGTGASFTATFASKTGDCGLPYWEISSVAVSTAGAGYLNGETLSVTPTAGSTVQSPATLSLATARTQPTLSASATGGSGASLTVAVASDGGSPPVWRVTSISGGGGTGYPDNAAVTVLPATDDVVQSSAQAVARTERVQPTVSASAGGAGVGAILSATLSQTTDGQGLDVWGVSAFSVSNGGSGYAVSNPVTVVVTDGVQQQGAIGAVASVHTATGAILSANVVQAGEFYKTNGVIDAVIVNDGGAYYKENPSSVTVTDGGRYYKEDNALTPYTTPITVTISQISPSAGTGADVSAVVETNTGSTAFGQITSITINNGGSDYLAWEEKQSLVEQGIEFASITGFDIGKVQVLGHSASACLQWFDITTCGTATATA